jgi:predicted RNase H-like nuclease (RuvC/YqgF family)
LKRQLSKKEETLEKYRNMIAELRQEIANQKEEEAREASKRTSAINDLADQSLKKARRKPEIVQLSNFSEE